MRGTAFVGSQVPRVRPRAGRTRLDLRSTTCPTCEAPQGADCVTVAGNMKGAPAGQPTGIHGTRKRMVQRAENARALA